MDTFLAFSTKTRRTIKGDGHCLPRAIFRGEKHLGLIPEHITYMSLFQATAKYITDNFKLFERILTETADKALSDLPRLYKRQEVYRGIEHCR